MDSDVRTAGTGIRNRSLRNTVCNLAPGKHSIKLTVIGRKAPESKGVIVNLAAFEVLR